MTWPQTLINNSYINPYEYKFQYYKIYNGLKFFVNYHFVNIYYVYDWNFILKKYYTYYCENMRWKIYDIDEIRIFKHKRYVFPFYRFYSFIIYNKIFNIYNVYEDTYYEHYNVTCKNIINDLYKAVCNILNQKINKDELTTYIIHCLNIINTNELLIKL